MNRFILKSQKEWILNLINKRGLEPSNFEWKEMRSVWYSDTKILCLEYKNTGYFFKFDFFDEIRFDCSYSPGEEKSSVNTKPYRWEDVAVHVASWLNALLVEVTTADPWEEIKKYIPGDNIDLEGEKANTSFTFKEVEHITKAINALKLEVKKAYNLTQDQEKIVNAKLDYLIEKSKSIGRVDWKNIFVGTIVSITFELMLEPGKVKTLWQLIKSCFGGILLLTAKS